MKKTVLLVIIAIICAPAFCQVNLTTGLIAYYPLDGTADDSSSNQLDGFMHGATSTADRFNNAGKALHFNGTDQYISVPHNSLLSITGSRSFSAWYKLDDSSMVAYPTILMKQGDQVSGSHPNYQLFLREEAGYNPRYRVSLLQGMGTNNKEMFTTQDYRSYIDTWVHIVATYDSADGYFRIYFNGTISDSLYAPSFTPNTSSDSLQIGRGNKFNYTQSYFEGSLDDIRIYGRVLNDAEVMALANESHMPAGINDKKEQSKIFTIYPNPFATEVNLIVPGNLKDKTTYRIYDMAGRIVVTTSVLEANTISLENLMPGTYILELVHGSSSEHHKLVKTTN